MHQNIKRLAGYKRITSQVFAHLCPKIWRFFERTIWPRLTNSASVMYIKTQKEDSTAMEVMLPK